MTIKAGDKVFITEDCRPGSPATGQVAIYDGDHPRTIILGQVLTDKGRIDWIGEYNYDSYASGRLTIGGTIPARAVYLEQAPVGDLPQLVDGACIAVPFLNPRMRLDDGSVIWGDECWWTPLTDGLTLADAEVDLAQTKALLREIGNISYVLAKGDADASS